MTITNIPQLDIDYYKEKAIKELEISNRLKNVPQLDDFEVNAPVLYDDNTGLYYGGSFAIPKGSLFFAELLVDKFPEIDYNDPERVIEALESTAGKKIQKGRFRDYYHKPLKKILKNRKIANKEFAISLMKELLDGDIKDLLEYLDTNKSYTPLDIAKFKLLKNLK